MSSSIAAISQIGLQLGEFTRQNSSIRIIAAPLLGAGAGGLRGDQVVTALQSGFCNAAADDATLKVHVLHKDQYDRLLNKRQHLAPHTKEPVRVFISHTSSSPEDKAFVQQLASFLIDYGIQARLDAFHLRRGMDLPQWMCNELALADKVVVVCDQVYKQKADGRLGGVGWVTMIIQGDMMALPPDSTKYQVLVRTEQIGDGLPLYLKSKYAYHVRPSDTTASYRAELVRELLDLPVEVQPPSDEFIV
jgi:hypothetical protein